MEKEEQREEETTEDEIVPPPPLPPPPEFSMLVDGSLSGGHVGEEISTARLGFYSCYPIVADKPLAGDGGERVIRR